MVPRRCKRLEPRQPVLGIRVISIPIGNLKNAIGVLDMSEEEETQEPPAEEEVKALGWQRQPIVAVLGHVDHGKTLSLIHI